jgi:hypothetical protein
MKIHLIGMLLIGCISCITGFVCNSIPASSSADNQTENSSSTSQPPAPVKSDTPPPVVSGTIPSSESKAIISKYAVQPKADENNKV